MVAPTLAGLVLALLTTDAHARAGYDHNHPGVRWHTLETEHFYVHWPESKRDRDHPHWFTTEWSAGRIAQIAEEAYDDVCGQFDYWLEEKVHIVVYDSDSGWEGNGFALAEWDWIGMAADWGPPFRPRGRMEFLSDVFVHEFGHIVSLKQYQPFSQDSTGYQIGGLVEDEEWLRRWGVRSKTGTNFDVGFDFTGGAVADFWWVEGGAEYYSHQAGYNFYGTSREAFMRMSVLEDRLLSRVEMSTASDKDSMGGERSYQQGYSMALWLRHHLGDDVMTQMAATSGEKWHASWDAVVEETTGVSWEQLYDDFVAHLREYHGATIDQVDARGPVVGRELWLTEPAWEIDREDPELTEAQREALEAWDELSKKRQDQAKDGHTAYIEHPRWSPDGEFLAWFDRGLNIRNIRPEQWGAIGGTYVEADDAKALKEWSRKTTGADWAAYNRVAWNPATSRQLVATGSEDFAPEFLMNTGLTFNADGYDWSQLLVGTLDTSGKQLEVDWELVPNTLRAVDVAWSPDGSTLAFSRYGDGTHELWTIRPDGTEARQLTDFGDGTQINGIDWSPDGTRILVGLYRNYGQDLWLLEVDTGAWTRLTESKNDELDPTFGPDGRVWFSSDPTGIYNVYSLDLDTHQVRRHTDLYGMAYGAEPTPGGHLMYTGTTAHGFRIFAVPADELAQVEVDYPGLCGPGACEDADEHIAFRPEDPGGRARSRPYNALKSQMPFSLWPVLRTTDKNAELGTGMFLGDYTEAHYLEGEATFGKDTYLYLSYFGDFWWPSLMAGYSRYSYKGTYGYGVDEDGLPETPNDVTVVDVKFEQASDDMWAYANYWASPTLWLGIGADASRYSFRDTGDGSAWVPYVWSTGLGAFIEWSPKDDWYYGDQWANPRGGRRVYLDYSYRRSHLVDPEIAGAVYDDGELLDRYGYHKLMATWTEFVPMRWFGARQHTLQLDFEAGWIDRNVMGWDEFIAGGRHPYHWGSGTIGNNVQFSGYEGWSLTGETMLIANATYRFPLARDLNWKVGPIYTEAIYLQGFGTIGNLWSYRVEGPSHVEGYSVVPDDGGSIRRELPFRDHASKNSPADEPHKWLTDVGAELRVRAFIWNDWDWDSFVRVAYGLQSTAGYGDVNADLIQSSVARDAASELSTEVEPPTLRVYAGIGTGW